MFDKWQIVVYRSISRNELDMLILTWTDAQNLNVSRKVGGKKRLIRSIIYVKSRHECLQMRFGEDDKGDINKTETWVGIQ